MPKVSVVIPTYKHRDFVAATLQSVFAQTFTDYEVIVVNDGSPDDTEAVLEPFAAAGRIRCFRQGNCGQAAARNRGLAEARGEFIALLDDDDLWGPDKLEWQVAALSGDDHAVLAYGYVRAFSQAGSETFPGPYPSGDVRKVILRQNWIWSLGQTLIRAEALRSIGGFDPTIRSCDEWDVYIRLARLGPFIYQEREALAYRTHALNASQDVGLMFRNLQRVRRKHFGMFPRPSMFADYLASARYIRGHCSMQFLRQSDVLLEQGRRGAALRQIYSACCVRPRLTLRRDVVSRLIDICFSKPPVVRPRSCG